MALPRSSSRLLHKFLKSKSKNGGAIAKKLWITLIVFNDSYKSDKKTPDNSYYEIAHLKSALFFPRTIAPPAEREK